MKKYQLGEFEEIVLLTIAILFDEAYGVSIRHEIETRLKRKVSVSALQTAMRRMETKGYLDSNFGEATAIRGGKKKRYFRVTQLGKLALESAKNERAQLWEAIPGLAFEFNK